MSIEYNFKEIEPKWQSKWEREGSHETNLSTAVISSIV